MGMVDIAFEIAVGQKLHRALQAAEAAQDTAADVEPDEQHRADQGRGAHRQHDRGRERNLLARMVGGGVGLVLDALDQLLHADVEADIELARFVENGLAIIEGLELLLAQLEHAGLAGAEREQLLRGLVQRLGAAIFRQQIEVGTQASLRRLEFLFDVVELVAGIGRQGRDQVGGREIAAGDDVAELAEGLHGLGGAAGGEVGRPENGVDLGLRVEHGRTCGGDEGCLRGAQCVIELVVLGGGGKPLAGCVDQAFGGLADVLDGLVEGGDSRSVGAELDDLAELQLGLLLDLLQLLDALGQSVLARRGQQRRSLGCEACGLRRQLQARGKPGNVPPAEVFHGAAEVAQHESGAGRYHDRHGGDHGEGGKQAAPYSPTRPKHAENSAQTHPKRHARPQATSR